MQVSAHNRTADLRYITANPSLMEVVKSEIMNKQIGCKIKNVSKVNFPL